MSGLPPLDEAARDRAAYEEGRRKREKKRKGNGEDFEPPPLEEEPETPFPVLDGAAYHGLAGQVVNFILPQTESDPSALLVQFHAAFGAMVGREAWYQVEVTRHYPNLFPLLVGDTSKARKGTSWEWIAAIFRHVDGAVKVIRGGLSTGEGLKNQVRDARPRPARKYSGRRKVRGDPAEEYDDEDDEKYAGVADKRLLVVEPEFARVLRVCKRPGNTLSATMREASDTGDLQICTKQDSITATGAHISIVGHITAEELRKELTETDMANGFGNRFLLCCVKRSKSLPRGGEDLDEEVLHELAREIAVRAGQARGVGRMRMTEGAYELWDSVYEKLSEPKGEGLAGFMIARSEAHAVRWAVPIALLDGKKQIAVEHLEAALALVDKGERSVRWVWPSGGVKQGNPAYGDIWNERILRWFQRNPGQPMTATDVWEIFGRHTKKAFIEENLSGMERRRFLYRMEDDKNTGGRPTKRWRLGALDQ